MTVFSWRRDADGYELSADGRIKRRGGKLLDYEPAKKSPPLHRTFAALPTQLEFAELSNAYLAFVDEFGFLNSDGGTEDYSEDVLHLRSQCVSLSNIGWFSSLHANRHNGIEFDEIPGPNVRMVMKPKQPHNRMQLYYEPESLYAWMWLRAADDLSSNVDWSGAPCLNCFSPMGRGSGAHRKDAEFCCAKCRTYFHRLSPKDQRKHIAEAKSLRRNETKP